MIYGGQLSLSPHPRPLPRKFTRMGLGLGVGFSDLPNGGHNLRLYTYDPPGTQYYSASGWIYNTGHYDVSIPSGPCGSPDAQGFNDWTLMSNYAGNRGETLVLVSRADLAALCSYVPPKATVTPAPATTCPTGYVSKSGGCYPPDVPPTVPAPTATAPSTSSEAAAYQAWLATHPGGTFQQWAASLTKTTTTTTTTSSAGAGGGGWAGGGTGGGGGAPVGRSDNTLLIAGLAVLAFLMLK